MKDNTGFTGLGFMTLFWTSTEDNAEEGESFILHFDDAELDEQNQDNY